MDRLGPLQRRTGLPNRLRTFERDRRQARDEFVELVIDECDADTETPPAPCLSRYHIVSAKSTISALSKVQTRHLSECRSGTLQGSTVPRPGDGARHPLNRVFRERRAPEQVEEQRPAARAEARAGQFRSIETFTGARTPGRAA